MAVISIQNPIVCPKQMPTPLICKPMDNKWAENLKQTAVWWYKGIPPNPANEREKVAMGKALILRDRLLSFGGNQACMDLYDKDYEKIMERGQLFYGNHAHKRKGEPCQCHRNASLLWDANRGRCSIATGYALSEDGMWRQHSWVVQPLKVKYRIWETTVLRVAYFGFIMTEEECAEFYRENC